MHCIHWYSEKRNVPWKKFQQRVLRQQSGDSKCPITICDLPMWPELLWSKQGKRLKWAPFTLSLTNVRKADGECVPAAWSISGPPRRQAQDSSSSEQRTSCWCLALSASSRSRWETIGLELIRLTITRWSLNKHSAWNTAYTTTKIICILMTLYLQCYDAVGWGQEGHPACKTERWQSYPSKARCRFAYCSADATATHYLLLQ